MHAIGLSVALATLSGAASAGTPFDDPHRWLEHERKAAVRAWWTEGSEASSQWVAERADAAAIEAWLAAERARERPLGLVDTLAGARVWGGSARFEPAAHKDGAAGHGPRWAYRVLAATVR